ncbi:MAG: Holliday junction branch migration protein RuvA [Gammaproteobacteria bacterium]
MIGFLRGKLAAKQPPQLVIDVNGVGYEVEAPMSTFYDLPGIGESLTLLTHLVVREDAQTLYGFATEDERRLFRSLLRISGIGAKMALGILSGISVSGFVRCVQTEDTASLVKVPGIGKKTAERLIVEMRDRIDAGAAGGKSGALVASGPVAASDEAFGALVALGYKPAEAIRLLKDIDSKGLTTEEIIRRALQAAVK